MAFLYISSKGNSHYTFQLYKDMHKDSSQCLEMENKTGNHQSVCQKIKSQCSYM